ncbi:MAG: anaerobic ribonucleoside triphosphate reductase [Bacteroides sp.]|nr:anaerobic ribonucleoside triphosphate reductase [Eubacterium sp.]MCM1417660.1 anaerobic ribonucleoside triphosphate reductase [Roseburia sp.]MCM1461875.1 anaerobic ribonucleoside triphosphate reductase [Bacteroides sp.]
MRFKKRDGRIVDFDKNKIACAVEKAYEEVYGKNSTLHGGSVEFGTKVADFICSRLNGDVSVVEIEDVQDKVEIVLMGLDQAIAKSYILYREKRTKIRDMNTSLMKTYADLTRKSSQDMDLKRENANIDGNTAMGTMLKYGSEGAKQFNSLYVLSPKHAAAHSSGDIHIHDFDFYMLTTTCCQIDLTKLFENGFSTGHGFLRKPNDIKSYAALACIAIQSNQNDQHGGQSIPKFDYDMAPGVKCTFIKELLKALELKCDFASEDLVEVKEWLNKKAETDSLLSEKGKAEIAEYLSKGSPFWIQTEKGAIEAVISYAEKYTDKATHQAMEALVHNLNTMNSRAGAQVPFSSINYGTDTSAEGRMIMRNLLLATEEGLGNGETAIFPVQVFKVKEGVNYNPGDPNYDLFKLACRVSARRLFPNFSFIDAPFNLPYYKEGDPNTEIAYMGCRTRVIGNVHDKEREIVTGRGNLSFTTINLPRLGILAKGDLVAFFRMLDERMDLVIEQLLERFKIQTQKKVKNYPFLMGQGVWIDSDKLKVDDCVGEILKHGTLSMGFIGLAECLVALIGKHHGVDDEAQKLGLEIVAYMRKRMDRAAEETKLNFSLLATPAEGLSGRFVRIDKKRFGTIPGVTDRDYYTNSFHVPVYHNISIFGKIRKEAPYHALTNAGHISYIELDGDPAKNPEAFEQIVRCMKEEGIGYGAINHPVDHDPVCGYTGIIDDVCPNCGRRETTAEPFDRIRRITGYLVGTLDRFNDAKRAEERDRVKHTMAEV